MDERKAFAFLENVSYFRFAAYLRPFKALDKHGYKENATFEKAVRLYEFDAKLRTLLFSAIQKIEISLRAKVINQFSLNYGAFWFINPDQCTDMPYQTHRYPLSDTSIERCFFLISRRAVTLLKASLNWRTIFTTSLSMSITTCSTMIGVPSVFQCVLCYGNWFAKANQLKPYIYSEVYLSSIDSFYQFVWCKYLHLGETKPLFA